MPAAQGFAWLINFLHSIKSRSGDGAGGIE